MVPEDGSEVQCCDLFCRDLVSGGFHNDHLGQAIHKDAEGGVSLLCLREVSDEVDGDTLPGSQGNIERLEEAYGKALGRLDCLAGGAGPNILIDESSHPGPVEGAGKQLKRLISSEMAGCGGVMGRFE